MACSAPRKGQTLIERMEQTKAAMKKLEKALMVGQVKVVIAPNGAITFAGWRKEDREDLTDACTYRTLTQGNSVALRQAIARAEATQGRKMNPQAVAAGYHSHDGGKTWDRH